MSREVALRLIKVFHDVAKRPDIVSSWKYTMPRGLEAMEAALDALKTGDSLDGDIGGRHVFRNDWVCKQYSAEAEKGAEEMREQIIGIIKQQRLGSLERNELLAAVRKLEIE